MQTELQPQPRRTSVGTNSLDPNSSDATSKEGKDGADSAMPLMEIRQGAEVKKTNKRQELSPSRDAHLPRPPLRAIEFFYSERLRPKLLAASIDVSKLNERISDLGSASAQVRIDTMGAIKQELEAELAHREEEIREQVRAQSGCCKSPIPQLVEAQKVLSAAKVMVLRLDNVIREERDAGIPQAKPPQ